MQLKFSYTFAVNSVIFCLMFCIIYSQIKILTFKQNLCFSTINLLLLCYNTSSLLAEGELLTLGEFCFTMIERASIEGSKSNVAMNARAVPQRQLCLWGGEG